MTVAEQAWSIGLHTEQGATTPQQEVIMAESENITEGAHVVAYYGMMEENGQLDTTSGYEMSQAMVVSVRESPLADGKKWYVLLWADGTSGFRYVSQDMIVKLWPLDDNGNPKEKITRSTGPSGQTFKIKFVGTETVLQHNKVEGGLDNEEGTMDPAEPLNAGLTLDVGEYVWAHWFWDKKEEVFLARVEEKLTVQGQEQYLVVYGDQDINNRVRASRLLRKVEWHEGQPSMESWMSGPHSKPDGLISIPKKAARNKIMQHFTTLKGLYESTPAPTDVIVNLLDQNAIVLAKGLDQYQIQTFAAVYKLDTYSKVWDSMREQNVSLKEIHEANDQLSFCLQKKLSLDLSKAEEFFQGIKNVWSLAEKQRLADAEKQRLARVAEKKKLADAEKQRLARLAEQERQAKKREGEQLAGEGEKKKGGKGKDKDVSGKRKAPESGGTPDIKRSKGQAERGDEQISLATLDAKVCKLGDVLLASARRLTNVTEELSASARQMTNVTEQLSEIVNLLYSLEDNGLFAASGDDAGSSSGTSKGGGGRSSGK